MTGRDVVDYALKRRARLAQVATGLVTVDEVCDAHPHLQLAAKHYGVPRVAAPARPGPPPGYPPGRAAQQSARAAHPSHRNPADCPVCRKPALVDVHFVYGDALGRVAGQAKAPRELELLDQQFPEFDVYVVEVCRDCGWNHLVRSYRMGHGGALSPAADG